MLTSPQSSLRTSLPKLAKADFAVVRAHMGPAPEALPILDASADAADALNRLEAAGLLVQATRLAAHAMPRREGVWWACMCAAHTAPPGLDPADRAAQEAAEQWVRRLTEEHGRAAMAAAERSSYASPEAWAAVGAFWSGPSMAPAGQPVVPPAPHLAGVAIGGAVALAAVRTDPAQQEARLLRFLASAHDIAGGGSGRLPPAGPP